MPAIVVASNETRLPVFAAALKRLAEGGSNAVGTFTLTPSATSTTVPAPTCAKGSVVLLSPQTAHAANDMATTSVVAGDKQFVVAHASNALNDRTFGFLVVG
jgi:hypothetical protein